MKTNSWDQPARRRLKPALTEPDRRSERLRPPPPGRPPRAAGVPQPLEELQAEAEDTLRTSKDNPPLPVSRLPLGMGGSPLAADVRPLAACVAPLSVCVSPPGFCVAPLAANVSPLPAGGLLLAVRVSPLPAKGPRLPADAAPRPAKGPRPPSGGLAPPVEGLPAPAEAQRRWREVTRDRRMINSLLDVARRAPQRDGLHRRLPAPEAPANTKGVKGFKDRQEKVA